MASHHRPHLLHTSACACSHYCHPASAPSPPTAAQPQPQQSDPLFQALASLLQNQVQLQSQPLQPQQNFCLNQTHFFKTFQDQNSASNFHQKQYHQQEPNFLISSLLSRINALEASLQHFSNTSSLHSYPSCSLRDAAARVIQTHFRAFLVRRSRTLRQLKDLAFIKSSLNSLKLSVSSKTHFDYEAVSRKAMDLLLKLDSFQGGDPMIRDGKRSVSRDLVQFLEYIDGLALKRVKLLYKNAKNVRVLGNDSKARNLRSNSRETMKKLRDKIAKLERLSRNEEGDEYDDVEFEGFQLIDERENPKISVSGNGGVCVSQNRDGGISVKRQGNQPRVKKSVSFAENGNVYRIISSENEASSSESVSSDEHREMVEDLCNETGDSAQNEEKVTLNDKEYLQSSNGEKNSRMNVSRQARSEIDGDYQIQDDDFVFSAPVPVRMESKADLMKKRTGALRIVS